ncbi:MAG: hypothetical protein RL757_476 [Bacteroidota bacterium]|jgi:hypothetical protein
MKSLLSEQQNNNIVATHELFFFTEYYQFYICDAATKGETDAPDFWNNDSNKRRLAIGEGILGVTVAKYDKIKVTLNVLEAKPLENKNADHSVEVSLRLDSGILKVRDCTAFDEILTLSLEKGTYRIRIDSFELQKVVNDEGDDYYVVQIWKSRFAKPKILKEFKPVYIS